MLETVLPTFGLTFALFCLLLVILPYLLGRRELINSWTIFMVGMANYVGVSAWQSGHFWNEFEMSRYTEISDETVMIFIAGTVLLMIGLGLGYYTKYGQFVERRPIRRWPREEPVPMLFCIVACCTAAVLGGSFLIRIPVVTQIAAIGGQSVIPASLMLAIVLWLRHRMNVSYFIILLVVFFLGMVFSFAFGSSRRPLLALLSVFPILLYFFWGRYRSRPITIALVLAVGLLVLSVLGAHSKIRHRYGGGERFGQIAQAIETTKMLPSAMSAPRDLLQTGLLGSDATSVSLGVIEIGDQVLPYMPFHTVYWLVTNPYPRAWWSDKPEGVGLMFPRNLGQWQFGRVNWGVGIVGQFYYDGGLYIMIFFGYILGVAMRWFDRMLVDQPHNPYLLGILAGISGHWVAVPRGEVSLFLLQSFSVFLFAIPIYAVARRWWGTAYYGYGGYPAQPGTPGYPGQPLQGSLTPNR